MEKRKIIDAHTHIFPDAIASRSIAALEKMGGVSSLLDGTLSSQKKAAMEAGVTLSLVLPVVTKPSQFASVNRFSAEVDHTEGFRSLGGIHPDGQIEEELDEIKALGLRGVKLHPDYQNTDIDDMRYIKILEGCKKRGLIAVIHAGIDPAVPEHVHCPPDRSAPVVRALTGEEEEPFIVLAHMGGIGQAELALEHLAGLPVYFDCSYVLEKMPQELFLSMVKAHKADRILFGTDSPWASAAKYVEYINALPLDEAEKDKIFYGNAARLLAIE